MRNKYSQEYKNNIVNRLQHGETIATISKNEKISRPTLYKWKRFENSENTSSTQPQQHSKTMEEWIEKLKESKNQNITHGRLCKKIKCRCDIYKLAGAIRQKYVKSDVNLTMDQIDVLANKYLDLYKNDKSYRHEIFYTALSNILREEQYKLKCSTIPKSEISKKELEIISPCNSSVISNLITNSHKLSIAPSYFKDIKNKIKTFEIRKNDKQFKIGDYLLLLECDIKFDNGQTGFHYTGKGIFVRITYILHNVYGILDDFVALGFEHLENSEKFENVNFNNLI